MSPTLERDPYDVPPTFWRRHEDQLWALAVFVLTAILAVVSFPPFHAPEVAYVLAAPAVYWAYFRPPLKLFAWTIFAAQAVAWTILLGWLHNVTWLGLALLGPFVGAWIGTWYLAVWWAMPRLVGRSVAVRVAGQLGLAGLWVLIEWSRTWLLDGFPWLPLAASQWQQVSILQVSAYTGAWGVSFVLIAMSIGFPAFLHRLLREGKTGLSRRSQEFGLALVMLMGCLCLFFVQARPFDPRQNAPVGRVAFVQPFIPQEVKWNPAQGPVIVSALKSLTREAAETHPDLILWPEAALPWPANGDPSNRAFPEALAAEARAPLLFGSPAIEPGPKGASERWYNAAFLAMPDRGLQHTYYAKRELVPFGEFVPFRPLLGWLSKVVPLGDGDMSRGTDASPLVIPLPDGAQAAGMLICYEDTFPRLARESALAGADLLVVLTNTGWFGTGGVTDQHAAHSVLRAVETRRPVLRCGNGGWSGWIDEFGVIRFAMRNSQGSVYFRGVHTATVTRDQRWVGRNSFYVEHGDWFVVVCAGLALLGYLAAVSAPRPSVPGAAGSRESDPDRGA